MYQKSNQLVFVHIQKTAGTSFASAVAKSLGENWTALGHDQSIFGSFNRFEEFDERHRAIVYPNLVPPNDAKLFTGHLCFSNFKKSVPHGQFITVLREPIARLISLWLYWRGATDEQLQGLAGWGERVKLSRGNLRSFVGHPDTMSVTDNAYARALLWPNDKIPDHCAISRSNDAYLIDRSLEALISFDFYAAIEDDLFTEKLSSWLGSDVKLEVHNKTKALNEELTVNLAKEVLEASDLLAQRTRIDRQIWEQCFDSRHIHSYVTRSLVGQFINLS